MSPMSQHQAHRLGLLGLVPIVVLAVLALLDICSQLAIELTIVYSAMLLSFLGGIHWGLCMRTRTDDDQQRQLKWALVPIIAGLLIILSGRIVSMAYPTILVLSLLALLHLFWFNYERRNLASESWYLDMRARQTFTIVALHVVVIIIH